MNIYRERAALIAHLAAQHPALILEEADPDAPDWPIIFIDTPTGQMSWHLHADDLDLFPHVAIATHDAQDPEWDGHTTEEKYQRLAELTEATWELMSTPVSYRAALTTDS